MRGEGAGSRRRVFLAVCVEPRLQTFAPSRLTSTTDPGWGDLFRQHWGRWPVVRVAEVKPAGVNRRAKCRSALLADPQILRGRFAPVLHLLIAHLGTLIEVAQAGFFHGRDVYKHVFAAVIGLNKSKSLSRVEPLHKTCRHVRTPF